jgi:hypothetical protein
MQLCIVYCRGNNFGSSVKPANDVGILSGVLESIAFVSGQDMSVTTAIDSDQERQIQLGVDDPSQPL